MRHATLIALLAAIMLAAAADDTWAQNLRPGAVVNGQLQDHQSSNVHLLDLTAGDKVIFRLKSKQSGLDAPGFDVMGPDFVPIASRSGRHVNRAAGKALVTGTHQITVYGDPGASLGYVLRIVGRRVAPYVPPAGGPPPPQPPQPGPPGAPGSGIDKAHLYLPAAMLGGERGEDLRDAAEMIPALADESAGMALDELQAMLTDAVLERIRDAIVDQGLEDEPLGQAGLDRILDVVDAERRAGAADARLEKLAESAAGTRLDGDAAFSAGMSMASAAILATRAAIEQEVRDGIPGKGQGPAAPGLAAPDPMPIRENLAGRAALERILMEAMMDQARRGDRDAADTALGLYEAYAVMLDGGAPRATRRRAQVERALEELLGILQGLDAPLELETEALPAPGIGEPFDILVRLSGGIDQSQVGWDVEGHDGIALESGPDGLRIRSDGETDPRSITVRAALSGREGEIEIYVEPQSDPKPLFEVVGRLLSGEGPLAGARVELRDGHQDGDVAETPGGRPLSTQVGEDGRFSLPYVEGGGHWLVVLVDGELAKAEEVPAGTPAETEKLNRIDVGEIRIER